MFERSFLDLQWPPSAKTSARTGLAVPLSLVISVGCAIATRAQTSATVPQFRDYPVTQVFRGPNANVALDTAEKTNYRTRLREASRQKANFAGHYVLTTWGCGTTCTYGAVVDLATGQVVFLPATTCCWGELDPRYQPVAFRLQSRLLVLSGMLDEKGNRGDHFFEFKNGGFTHILTIPEVPRSVDVPLTAIHVRGEDGSTGDYPRVLELNDQDAQTALQRLKTIAANSSIKQIGAEFSDDILAKGLKALVAMSASQLISSREYLLYNPQAALFVRVEIQQDGSSSLNFYSLERVVRQLGPLKPAFQFDSKNTLKNSVGYGGAYFLVLAERLKANDGLTVALRSSRLDDVGENTRVYASFVLFLQSAVSAVRFSHDYCTVEVNKALAAVQKRWHDEGAFENSAIDSLALSQVLGGEKGYRTYTYLDEVTAHVYLQIVMRLIDGKSCELVGHPVVYTIPIE